MNDLIKERSEFHSVLHYSTRSQIDSFIHVLITLNIQRNVDRNILINVWTIIYNIVFPIDKVDQIHITDNSLKSAWKLL